MPRGGARKGSGRKLTSGDRPKVKINITISQDNLDWLDQRENRSKVIDQLIELRKKTEKHNDMPTPEQLSACFLRCAELTRFYRYIYLVRLDERTGNLIILAGETLELQITLDGGWEFLNEPT